MFKLIYLLSFCLECTLEVLPALGIAWLLGCLFWWAYSTLGYRKKNAELQEQLMLSQQRVKSLDNELATIHFNWERLNTELNSLRNNYSELEIRYKALEAYKGTTIPSIYEPVPPPLSLLQDEIQTNNPMLKPDEQKIIYNNLFSSDDLTIIEGISQKVETLLKENEIGTWTRLSVANVEQLRLVLAKAGSKYTTKDPSSWPRQAELARNGQWDELIRLQKQLNKAGIAKVKKQHKKLKDAVAFRIDDLKIIEGIGPKIEQLLKDGGIDNWWKLATATTADIKQILKGAGDRYLLTDPSNWPIQAQLAAEEKWEELKLWQKQLKRKKESE